MEFVVDPADRQLAEVERGLDGHNSGVASAPPLREFKPSSSNPAGSWPGWSAPPMGANCTFACCG